MKISKSLAALFCGACIGMAGLGAAPAFAEPVAPPAAPAPDAERMALAQQIYQIVGDQTLSAMSGALKTMLGSMTARAGGPDQAHTQAMQAALSSSLDRMMPKVLQGTIQIMAQDFTAEQLRAMLAFYQSPAGQAVLQKMPEVTRQSIQLSQSLVPQMMLDFESDYCRRVTCTDKEQQAFAQTNARMSQAFGPAAASH